MHITKNSHQAFQAFIWDFYRLYGRTFAWRNIENPYYIVVSEVMLQQTQTKRVQSKFEQFIHAFPTFEALAYASLRDLLFVWQGLGYNRRAIALQKIAHEVITTYHGMLPNDVYTLRQLPGIGPATAGSIAAFAFNIPTVFIETNIRTVFIHSFFKKRKTITDEEIMPLIEQTLDTTNPRVWYYALMDYGVTLKQQLSNPSRKSKHYTKQSKFEGSDRQIRGAILRLLTQHDYITIAKLPVLLKKEKTRIKRIVEQLIQEQFVYIKDEVIFLC